MKGSLLVSSIASGQGKTLFTAALLHHFSKVTSIRAFKTGPDYIDPLFHREITKHESLNLDGFLMSEQEILNTFYTYSNGFSLSIIEGAMGFYDGIEKKTSARDIANLLNVPVILILSAAGSYSTIAAILKGILEYRSNTIRGIVLNKISSLKHYTMIRDALHKEYPDLQVCGYIMNLTNEIPSRHLGLNTDYLSNIDVICKEALTHVNLDAVQAISEMFQPLNDVSSNGNKEPINEDLLALTKDKELCIVRDEAFCFLYYDNLNYLQSLFKKVHIISACNNEHIPESCSSIYIPGGYVETERIYNQLSGAKGFQKSLISSHQSGKPIYAECAGLMYLGKHVDAMQMSGILPLTFTMGKKRTRLGYYFAKDYIQNNLYRGHAFHYSIAEGFKDGEAWGLFKPDESEISPGAWKSNKTTGTYLHTFFRNQPSIIQSYFV